MRPTIGTRETRTASASLRTDDSKFQLSGIAAAYNTESSNLGGFTEKIAPGAFTRSLKAGADVRCLFNHDASKILGRTKAGTLVLSDSPQGLRFVVQLDRSNTDHANLYAAVKRGDIDSCSFGFTVPSNGDSWNGNLRTLLDVDLLDVSPVCYPAYPEGTAVGARNTKWAATRLKLPTLEEAIRSRRVASVAAVVADDLRKLSVEEVSSARDFMRGKLAVALASRGNGWRYIDHDDEAVYALPLDALDDDEDQTCEDCLRKRSCRFGYKLDENGEVVLDEDDDSGDRALPITPRIRAVVEELRADAKLRKRMKCAAGRY